MVRQQAATRDDQGHRRGRGRPPAADPRDVAATACRLFIEQGYEQTSMEEIAEACGMGRSTLFRYFPSKSHVLWYGQEWYIREFAKLLSRTATDMPFVDAAFAAYRQLVTENLELVPTVRIQIVAALTAPEESAGLWGRYNDWAQLIAEFVPRRASSPLDELAAKIAGRTVWGAIWSAVTSWAVAEDADLDEFLDRARDVVRDLGALGARD